MLRFAPFRLLSSAIPLPEPRRIGKGTEPPPSRCASSALFPLSGPFLRFSPPPLSFSNCRNVAVSSALSRLLLLREKCSRIAIFAGRAAVLGAWRVSDFTFRKVTTHRSVSRAPTDAPKGAARKPECTPGPFALRRVAVHYAQRVAQTTKISPIAVPPPFRRARSHVFLVARLCLRRRSQGNGTHRSALRVT